MSQFFWKVKLRVLLDRLFLDSGSVHPAGKEAATQLKCLKEWVNEGRSQLFSNQFSNSFTNPESKPFTNPGFDFQQSVPLDILTCLDARKVFWWFWRCYPQVVEKALDSETLKLWLHAQNSTWSQVILSSALETERLGYFTCIEDYLVQATLTQEKPVHFSRSYLAQFSFTSISEFVHTGCTLQDVQLAAWLSHYLAAKICWKIAWKYGPDIFLSPCLYAQPLIDDCLLQQYPDFSQWISPPTEWSKSKARFPSMLTLILPDNGSAEAMKGNPVWGTMLHAEQMLKQEWLAIARQALNLQSPQNTGRQAASQEWESWLESWLDSQWQSCWVALPIIDRSLAPIAPDSLASDSLASDKLPVQQSLIHEIHQRLKTARYSQVWKIPTAFSLRLAPSEGNPELLPDSGAVMRGLSQLPQLLGSSFLGANLLKSALLKPGELSAAPLHEILAHAPVDRFMPAAKWHLLAAGKAELIISDSEKSSDAEIAAYAAFHHALSNLLSERIPHLPHLPYLIERQHGGRVISASDELLLSGSLQGWEQMLWEIYQCFTTLDWSTAIRFGLVIAYQSVPLPIALKHLEEAKTVSWFGDFKGDLKQSGVEVRLLHRSGQVQTASASWEDFNQWRSLLECAGLQPALFDQLAYRWKRHPAPSAAAIKVWVTTVCDDLFKSHRLNDRVHGRSSFNPGLFSEGSTARLSFCETLAQFLDCIWRSTQDRLREAISEANEEILRDRQVQAWLALAALTLRNRAVISVEQGQNGAIAPCQSLP